MTSFDLLFFLVGVIGSAVGFFLAVAYARYKGWV